MKVQKENMERVTKMVAEEVQALKVQCDRERENAKIIKIEAERVNATFKSILFGKFFHFEAPRNACRANDRLIRNRYRKRGTCWPIKARC